MMRVLYDDRISERYEQLTINSFLKCKEYRLEFTRKHHSNF